MKILRYTANNGEIARIQEALRTNSMGIGLNTIYDITVQKKDKHISTLILTPNDPNREEINPIEFFVFGIIVGRDYLKKNIILFSPK